MEPIKPPQLPRHNVKQGRNEPCICNSGKKYKYCCFITQQEWHRKKELERIEKERKDSEVNKTFGTNFSKKLIATLEEHQKEVIKNKLGFKPSPLGAAMLFAALSGTLTHNPSLYKKQ
jgi:hypothetical protein